MPLAYPYSDQTESWHNNEAKKIDPAIASGSFCNQHEMEKVLDQYLTRPRAAIPPFSHLHALFINLL